jgi:hypothetical protein
MAATPVEATGTESATAAAGVEAAAADNNAMPRQCAQAPFGASRRQSIMARSDKTAKSPAAAKTGRPVTLKHLAAALAEEHQMTKRAGQALLGELVGLIIKHLKKGADS